MPCILVINCTKGGNDEYAIEIMDTIIPVESPEDR
jgi:hypothetical protein